MACLASVRCHSPTQVWEVFAFSSHVPPSTWLKFDWDKLTTLCLVGNYDTDLILHAHSHGVKVVLIGNIPKADLPHSDRREAWVKRYLKLVTEHNLDGLNFDFEEDVGPESPEAVGYTDLVRETTEAFKKVNPDYQISIDFAWSANNIDGRYFDILGISKIVDLIFGKGKLF